MSELIDNHRSDRQEAIKRYCKQWHDRGMKPKIKDIAEAFGIDPKTVRDELAEIRAGNLNKNGLDLFNRLFGK